VKAVTKLEEPSLSHAQPWEPDDALQAQEAPLASLRLDQREAIRIEDATIATKNAGGRGAAARAWGTLRNAGRRELPSRREAVRSRGPGLSTVP
jgi:hypothetical protein